MSIIIYNIKIGVLNVRRFKKHHQELGQEVKVNHQEVKVNHQEVKVNHQEVKVNHQQVVRKR